MVGFLVCHKLIVLMRNDPVMQMLQITNLHDIGVVISW